MLHYDEERHKLFPFMISYHDHKSNKLLFEDLIYGKFDQYDMSIEGRFPLLEL